MTTLARIAIALIMALLLSSCGFDINIGDFGTGVKGNGDVVTENREITDDFTEVSASEGIEVFVTQANDFEISVEADENVIDLIGTDIKNGKLRIHAIENIGRATKKVYVELPDVSLLSVSSGANLTTDNKIKTDKLEIEAFNGALGKIEFEADDAYIEARNGANLKLIGSAQSANIEGRNGANIDARNLVTKICIAEAAGGGNMQLNVTEKLTADAHSGGNIGYSGDASVQKKKSMSGSVHKN